MKQTAVEWLVQEINKINVSTEARMFINKLEKQAKEMEQINIDNKVIHFAEWLTKKHALTLIALYEQFKEEQDNEQI